jgi:hypothetical protein
MEVAASHKKLIFSHKYDPTEGNTNNLSWVGGPQGSIFAYGFINKAVVCAEDAT